jgi:hypothetical protein
MPTVGPEFPKCECGENKWFHMMDSLAFACEACGRVIVMDGHGGWEPGVSLQEWAKDLYEQGRGEEEE